MVKLICKLGKLVNFVIEGEVHMKKDRLKEILNNRQDLTYNDLQEIVGKIKSKLKKDEVD